MELRSWSKRRSQDSLPWKGRGQYPGPLLLTKMILEEPNPVLYEISPKVWISAQTVRLRCPACGAVMNSISCKMKCPTDGCGYFESCNEY